MDTKKKKRKKKPNDGLNAALICCVVFAVLFTICIIVLFCMFQSTPDVLIGAVFAALFGELGCCTLIYKVKYPKAFKDEEDLGDPDLQLIDPFKED